jgi:NAD(P)-dependent dehydrogenase (short-subunit alcohol dehydrogenase family)
MRNPKPRIGMCAAPSSGQLSLAHSKERRNTARSSTFAPYPVSAAASAARRTALRKRAWKLLKVMAVELAEQGINVNDIVPGPIATDVGRAMHDPDTVAAYNFLVPQRRYGEVHEIASAAVFLASSESDYINGLGTRSTSTAASVPRD